MKRILFVLSMLVSVAYGQSIGYWRYDTVVLQKIGGNSELKVMNATRGVTGGVLTNMGNGRTAFVTPSGSTNTSIGSGFKVAVNGTNNVKSITLTNGLTADSATSGQVGGKLGGNLTGNTNIGLGGIFTGYTLGVSSDFSAYTPTYPTALSYWSNAARLWMQAGDGGNVNYVILDSAASTLDSYSGTYWYSGYNKTLQTSSAVHWTALDKHHYLTDLKGSLDRATIEINGFTTMKWMVNGYTSIAQRSQDKVGFNGTALNTIADLKGFVHFYKSAHMADTFMYAKKMYITDSTGYDIMLSKRASPFETKIMSVPALASLIGGGGGGVSIYTNDDVFTSDRFADLDGKKVRISDGPALDGTGLSIDPTVNNEVVSIMSKNTTGGDNLAYAITETTATYGQVTISTQFNGGTGGTLQLISDGSDGAGLVYSGDYATINGTSISLGAVGGAVENRITVTGIPTDYARSNFYQNTSVPTLQFEAVRQSANLQSILRIDPDSIALFPGSNGLISIDSIRSSNNANDSAIVWNPLTKRLGKRPVASGGSTYNAGNSVTISNDSLFARKASQSLTDGATITVDLQVSMNGHVTLGGNRTLAFTNITTAIGSSGILVFTQDGTGSRTLTLPATCKVVNGGAGALTLTTTAAAVDIISFYVFSATLIYVSYGRNFN